MAMIVKVPYFSRMISYNFELHDTKLIMSTWDENNDNGNNILSIYKHTHTHIGLANDW
jgi:hypothetical protein